MTLGESVSWRAGELGCLAGELVSGRGSLGSGGVVGFGQGRSNVMRIWGGGELKKMTRKFIAL